MTASEEKPASPEVTDSLYELFVSVPASSSTADRVYSALLKAIETGRLPQGARLAEESLAEAFQVSRTPIREALVRIEAEGHAERDRHGGLFVSRITTEQIIELYVVREALDGAAARLAASHADLLDISQLKHINTAMESAASAGQTSDLAHLNIEFHAVLARASNNAMLEAFVGQIHRYVRRFSTTTFSDTDRRTTAVREHWALISAIEHRNPDLAESIAREHMRGALHVRIRMESSS